MRRNCSGSEIVLTRVSIGMRQSFGRSCLRWLFLAGMLAFAGSSLNAAPLPQTKAKTTSTAAKKKKTTKKKRVSKRMQLPKGPTQDRITEIQSALARGGYYKNDPNGKWDADTIAATQKFQSANGLDSTGNLDARTLQKLGLGSDVAGISAPKPPMPPGSLAPSAPASSQPSPTIKPSGSASTSKSSSPTTTASISPVSASN